MEPSLVTRLTPEDKDPNSAVRVRFCSSCHMFHPVRCFHRDRSMPGGRKYVCRVVRSEARPSTARPCVNCGGKRGRWHKCEETK